MRERFAERGKQDVFDELSIFMQANADVVIKNMDKIKFPKHIENKTECKELLNSVRKFEEAKKNKNFDVANIFKDRITESQERKFRDVAIGELRQFKTPKEKLRAIQNNPKFKWIGELYPAVYTIKKKILFMSIDKFILGNSTIIEPTYRFYNNPIIKNAVIFIDEFDATREKILTRIIEDGVNNNIDYLNLFKQIHASLKTREFPKTLTTNSENQKQYLKEHPNSNGCDNIIDGFQKVFGETYDKFSMQYSFKTKDGETKNDSRNFIFNDLHFHSIFANKKAFVQINTDKKNNQNWLKFIENRPSENSLDVVGLLSSVRGCIKYYLIGCNILAYNYKNLKSDKRDDLDDDFTLDNAVTSILKEFQLSNEYQKYLKPIIISEQLFMGKKYKDISKELSFESFDHSIYDKGFRYYDFIDDLNHDMQSEIKLYDFPQSPESILLNISKKAKVVGISATATIDTVIGNYDVEYLQKMLQKNYYTATDEDMQRLNNEFAKGIIHYDNVNINVDKVSCTEEDWEKDLESVFISPANAKRFKEKIENTCSNINDKKYDVAQFVKIVKVMKAFILNQDVKSFLCLSNKLPKENYDIYNLSLLKEIAHTIIRENKVPNLIAEKLIFSIDSKDYDDKCENMLQRLSDGEKLFVLSSYSTIGLGQNLQYQKPNDIQVVEVNDYDRGEPKKDFDCIYLECPTNLIVNIKNISDTNNDNDKIKFIYQVEFLMERGEISRNDGVECIKCAFSENKNSNKVRLLYKTPSVNNSAIRTLIQAVGRICRTRLKNKDIFIFVDEKAFEKYDFSMVEDRMLNPEFRKIVEFAKATKLYNNIIDEVQILENRASYLSMEAMKIINEIRHTWNDESIFYWKGLRELLLKYPTMSIEEINGNLYSQIYFKAPKAINSYSYTQEGDYTKNVNIKFDKTLAQKMSEEDCGLQELLKIPRLRDYFIQQGYATSFARNEYLLTASMYNNIYKGALGEVVGKFIFDQYISETLYELPQEHFELFDFTLGNGVYIDFKLWKGNMLVDAEKEKQGIINKLDICGGRRAVIINIKYDREAKPTTSAKGKIVEIPYLYRSDKHEIDREMISKIIKEGYLK